MFKKTLFAVVLIAIALFGYTKVMAKISLAEPPLAAPSEQHISYPNENDKQAAAAAGHAPGGNIMIHSLPNGWGWLKSAHRLWDWTDGCIAVTDAEMRDIWARVPTGTPIEILP